MNSKKFALGFMILFLSSEIFGASPLVLKKSFVSKSDVEYSTIGTLATLKYKQIRIGFTKSDVKRRIDPGPQTMASIELNAANREVSRKESLFGGGLVSKLELEQARDRLESAQAALRNLPTVEVTVVFEVCGIEGDDIIVLETLELKHESSSLTIDSPPSRLLVRVKGTATTTIFVWATS